MNLQELKNKILKSCEILESADIDLSRVQVNFDIDFHDIDTYGQSNNITMTYNLLDDDEAKVTIRID